MNRPIESKSETPANEMDAITSAIKASFTL